MESLAYKLAMEDSRPILSSSNDITSTTTTPESPSVQSNMGSQMTPDGMFPPMLSTSSNAFLNYMAQQEPRTGDTAPSSADYEEIMMHFRRNGPDSVIDDIAMDSSQSAAYMGSRAESMASTRGNLWSDARSDGSNRQTDQLATFDFLVKSISAANNYVSMLTREQLTVLQSLSPNLLYEFLSEVAKVRGDRRMRRALPNECAFCKNNGENEECYTKHALKDWRGRVLCPVLRAFRCPRCGATGERAHTIKYCPENNDSERSGGLASRRRVPSSTSLIMNAAAQSAGTQPQTPTQPGPAMTPSPSSANLFNTNIWSNFG